MHRCDFGECQTAPLMQKSIFTMCFHDIILSFEMLFSIKNNQEGAFLPPLCNTNLTNLPPVMD